MLLLFWLKTLQKKEKELSSKDREEIQDLKAEVVFLNAENKELKSKAKVGVTSFLNICFVISIDETKLKPLCLTFLFEFFLWIFIKRIYKVNYEELMKSYLK